MNYEELKKVLHEGSNLSLIFQLTDKCVLSCKYCFARGAHLGENPKVSDGLLERVISQSFTTRHNSVSFEWTGGEAFLMGKTFFESVLSFQKRYATKPYTNGVQTSGYLFDKELIDFLVDNGFVISVTIDGTKAVHNANRPAQNNHESFDNVMKTRAYVEEKQGYCGFISTVTKNNLGKEKEILEFYRGLNISSFHSNPYIFFEKNIVKDKCISLNEEEYASYFIAQFNAWFEQGKLEPIPLTLDYFMKGLSLKMMPRQSLCVFGGRCLTNFLTVTPNGDCYTCPKFTGHTNMKLGNLYKGTIKEMIDEELNEKMEQLVRQRLSAIEKCEKSHCKFMYLCNAGCPYYSYITSNGENISEKDILCEGKTLLMEYLDSVNKAIEEGVI